MARIGLFGGAFDPPTRAHIDIIKGLLASGDVDEVWLAPSSDRRYDRVLRLPIAARLALLRRALRTERLIDRPVRIALEHSLANRAKSSTYALIKQLKARYPQHQFWCVIGADNFRQLPRWRYYKKLIKICDFLVIPRSGVAVRPRPVPPWAKLVPIKNQSALSSTIARKRLEQGQSLSGYLPRGLVRATKRAWNRIGQ